MEQRVRSSHKQVAAAKTSISPGVMEMCFQSLWARSFRGADQMKTGGGVMPWQRADYTQEAVFSDYKRNSAQASYHIT
jgi:hypothetical protein